MPIYSCFGDYMHRCMFNAEKLLFDFSFYYNFSILQLRNSEAELNYMYDIFCLIDISDSQSLNNQMGLKCVE